MRAETGGRPFFPLNPDKLNVVMISLVQELKPKLPCNGLPVRFPKRLIVYDVRRQSPHVPALLCAANFGVSLGGAVVAGD